MGSRAPNEKQTPQARPLQRPEPSMDIIPMRSEDTVPNEWSMDLINAIEWKIFEELICQYFRVQGRDARVTCLGADEGVDIRLHRHDDADKVIGVVQCKAWKTKKVNVSHVREFFGVVSHFQCHLGVLYTIKGYTKDAEQFVADKPIKLLDSNDLLVQIKKLPLAQQQTLLEQATSGDYRTPSCPQCGIKMVRRKVKKSFWGCRNYPKCRHKFWW